jgi:hypothetical protein
MSSPQQLTIIQLNIKIQCNFKIKHPIGCCTKKTGINTCSLNTTFVKHKYSYMFRPCEVMIRLSLEHFKRNIQIALLETRSHFLHNIYATSVFLCNSFKLLMSIKYRKLSYIKLWKYRGGRCQRGLWGSRVLCWVPCGIFLKQYTWYVRKYYDWLNNYTACCHTALTYSEGVV